MRRFLLSLSVLLVIACRGQEAINRETNFSSSPPLIASTEPSSSALSEGMEASSITLIKPEGSIMHLQVDIADEESEWASGLMHRTSLAQNAGMLFVFPTERPLTFWMKNTLIPLDVLFFNKLGELVSATGMVPCSADPCATYSANSPALYALEVNGGFIEENNVQPGWRLALPIARGGMNYSGPPLPF